MRERVGFRGGWPQGRPRARAFLSKLSFHHGRIAALAHHHRRHHLERRARLKLRWGCDGTVGLERCPAYQGVVCRVQGAGCRVQGAGCRVRPEQRCLRRVAEERRPTAAARWGTPERPAQLEPPGWAGRRGRRSGGKAGSDVWAGGGGAVREMTPAIAPAQMSLNAPIHIPCMVASTPVSQTPKMEKKIRQGTSDGIPKMLSGPYLPPHLKGPKVQTPHLGGRSRRHGAS